MLTRFVPHSTNPAQGKKWYVKCSMSCRYLVRAMDGSIMVSDCSLNGFWDTLAEAEAVIKEYYRNELATIPECQGR